MCETVKKCKSAKSIRGDKADHLSRGGETVALEGIMQTRSLCEKVRKCKVVKAYEGNLELTKD